MLTKYYIGASINLVIDKTKHIARKIRKEADLNNQDGCVDEEDTLVNLVFLLLGSNKMKNILLRQYIFLLVPVILFAGLLLLLPSCKGGGRGGGGSRTGSAKQFAVGGTVSGLSGTVVLQNNGGNDLTIMTNGQFAFSTVIEDGGPYIVTVLTQPLGQTCSVANGTGTIDGANILNVMVACKSLSGTLDTTFGAGGKVSTNITTIGPGSDYAYAVLIQADGKIVVAGQTIGQQINNAFYFDFALVRYDTEGNLDNSFGTNGKVTTVGITNSANALAIQGDEKILAAGTARVGSKSNFALVRYNPNGSLDSTFGNGGIVVTTIGSGSDYGKAVAIQGDGKIIVAGSSWNGNYFDFALVRYNADGNLDNSFGTGGIVTTGVRGSTDADASAMKIQMDGKILVAGGSGAPWSGINFCFTIARFNTDGGLDNTFGSGGIVTTELGNGSHASALALQGNGKIIATGGVDVNNDDNFALIRYNLDGSLDATFGTNGTVITSIGGGSASASSVMIQNNGKIVAAGKTISNNNSDVALARYNSDGSLDSEFGTDGVIVTDLGSSNDRATDLAIQSDGGIVVVGETSLADFADFVVVRYLP